MRLVLLVVSGVLAVAVLVSLGLWQVQRLHWKQEILTRIETRISADPSPLPATFDEAADRYRPVEISGRSTGEELHVLVSTAATGAGYRVIVPFETDEGRRIMVDLGVIPTEEKAPPRAGQHMDVLGNLHWPQETDRFTPDPERGRNIWFARDVPIMAETLGTEPVLVVARRTEPPVPDVLALPITTEGIPNDHLNYAITWFSLAAICAGMTLLLALRMARGKEETDG
ncbi:surfeit locus 1 family protein [Palleronia aestuarii]|uniref:SURF1-like protein n=1 Tax=Palleronia aestuarii TaxID=568105 RepID=A0A2W7NNJ7_9RHOB|nr:SURF1 family protein [Palleronia aestuarii]PZX19697.1 surfeit locus 1 family protein [Palleronia aestuarii]